MADPYKEGVNGFTPIASNISLYNPQPGPSAATQIDDSPALIVLCSWMGAAPKHIAKYTACYQAVFPGVAILLVQSSLGDVFASDKKQKPRIETACDTILSFQANNISNPSILLHAMSNGGAIAATRMARLFNDRGNGKVFGKFICDCMPSKPNVEKGVQAVVIGLPRNFLIQFLGKMVFRVWMHVGMFVRVVLLRQEDILTKLRRLLNDTDLFDPAASRLYMYTKKDALVPHEDVHEHANDARGKGWKEVKEVVFQKSPHCSLIVEDPQLYRDSIRTLVMG